MNVKKAIKKVIALGAGATMIGATIMGAMAADLNNYPNLFVKDGAFNAYLIVGDDAAAKDVVGAVDIATSLQFNIKKTTTVTVDGGSSSTVLLDGDSWEVATSTKHFELGESFVDVQSVIDDSELDALADGEFKTGKGSADYEQTLTFAATATAVYEEDTDNNVVGEFLKIVNNAEIANYTMTFTTTADSEINTAKTSQLEDFKDKKLKILGKEFTITKATFSGTEVELTLMGGAVMDTISEGDTKTYTLDGKDYEVESIIITDSGTIYTQMKINGEVTDKLAEGDTYTLADDVDIGIKTLLNNEAGDVTGDLCDFYLGADKLVLKDTTVTGAVSVTGGTMKLGEETMDEVSVSIKGTNTSSEFKLEVIQFAYTADDDFWLAPGQKLSEKMEEPEGLINWDLDFRGFGEEQMEDINFKSASDDSIELEVELDSGKVTIPLVYSLDDSNVRLGDSSNQLTLSNANIVKDQYFLLTTAVGQGEKSYVLQYKGTSEEGDSTAQLKFDNLAAGTDDVKRSFSFSTNTGTLGLGGTTFAIANTSLANADNDDFNISITGGVAATLITEGDAMITFSDANGELLNTNSTNTNTSYDKKIQINVTEVDDDNMLEDNSKQTWFSLTFDDAGDADLIRMNTPTIKTGATYAAGATVTLHNDPDDSDIKMAMTPYGADIKYEVISSSPNELEIKWPADQRIAQAFVTSGKVTATKIGGSVDDAASETVETANQKIQVGAAKLASQVAGKEKDQNLILIGGPCINAAAGVITGFPFVDGKPQYGTDKCGMGLVDGKAKIKLYENGDYVAMLVAGFSADDTKKATTVIANYADHALEGMEVDVSGASVNDITVTKVVVAE